jgi:hypothetical protein
MHILVALPVRNDLASPIDAARGVQSSAHRDKAEGPLQVQFVALRSIINHRNWRVHTKWRNGRLIAHFGICTYQRSSPWFAAS